MIISEIKNDLHRLVVETNDVNILKAIQTIFSNINNKENDWWLELTDNEKALITKGLKESASGELTSNEAIKKGVKEWLRSKS